MRELNTTDVASPKPYKATFFLNVLDALEAQVFRAESAELIHHFSNGAKLVHTWEAPSDYCLHIPA
jgi:hypothetical protein